MPTEGCIFFMHIFFELIGRALAGSFFVNKKKEKIMKEKKNFFGEGNPQKQTKEDFK